MGLQSSGQLKWKLSAFQLTVLMLCLIFGPIAAGLVLFFSTPTNPEPPLPAMIQFGATRVGGSGELESVSVPCIVIKNTSDGRWGKLSIGLNEQFYSSGNLEVLPRSEVSIPLESFIARNGNVRFPVGTRKIKTVTVFAQLEDGSRGISEFTVENLLLRDANDWIEPVTAKRHR